MLKLTSIRLSYIAIFIAVMSIGSAVKIPIALVPISLQSIFPLLAGSIFDIRTAFFTQLGYLVLGLSGLPIFAQGGGLSYAIKPSFGYLLAMPITASWVAFWVKRINMQTNRYLFFVITMSGSIILLFLGTFWLYVIMKSSTQNTLSFQETILLGFVIFIPGEIIKSLVVVIIAPRIRKIVLF